MKIKLTMILENDAGSAVVEYDLPISEDLWNSQLSAEDNRMNIKRSQTSSMVTDAFARKYLELVTKIIETEGSTFYAR